MTAFTLVWPAREHLASYRAALERDWSPDNVRGVVAAREQLQQIATDPDAFLATRVDPEAKAGPIRLPDGSEVKRLPGFSRWMWDGEFCARSASAGNPERPSFRPTSSATSAMASSHGSAASATPPWR